MISKAKLKEHIKDFPEEFTLDELVEKLIFIEKVELGISQSEAGMKIMDSELDIKLKEWFN